MNTVGTLVGAGFAGWTVRFASGTLRAGADAAIEGRDLRPVLATAGALTVFFLEPFNLTLEVGTTVSRIKAFADDPWQFQLPRDEGLEFLLTAIFVMSVASYMAVIERRWAGRVAAFVGVVTVCALEASQAINESRMPGLWDALVASLGAFAGAGLWVIAGRVVWPRLWDSVLIGLTAIAAALLMLSPFDWSRSFGGFAWYPDYGQGAFPALSQQIEIALLYFPIGFCFTYGHGSRLQALPKVLMTTLGIALPMGFLRGWTAFGAADLLNVVTALTGAGIGMMAAGPRMPGSAETIA
jgi:hypothetical protein